MIRMAINHIPCFAQYIHMAKDNGHFCCGKKLFCHFGHFFLRRLAQKISKNPVRRWALQVPLILMQ
jgi:hypothetical protein